MKLLKNKKFYTSILIDFSFLLILYGFMFFIIKKIREYAFMLQNFGADLSNIEAVVQENRSMLDYSLIMNNLEVVNKVMQKISLYLFLLLAGGFVLYCLFQGFQWSYILKVKFKKYISRFSIVSLASLALILLFLWYILFNIRTLMMNYFEGLSLTGSIIKIIFWFVLIFVLGYYTHVSYVFLGENNIRTSLKKTYKFRNLKSILTSLGLFLLILSIIVFFLIENLSGFWLVVELILILFVWNSCRYHLVRILKN